MSRSCVIIETDFIKAHKAREDICEWCCSNGVWRGCHVGVHVHVICAVFNLVASHVWWNSQINSAIVSTSKHMFAGNKERFSQEVKHTWHHKSNFTKTSLTFIIFVFLDSTFKEVDLWTQGRPQERKRHSFLGGIATYPPSRFGKVAGCFLSRCLPFQ